ncbi:cytochrome c oxidase subunit 2 [Bienertia sinuspersici]
MFIAIPSFALLDSMDEVVVDPAITIKVIGHQWYRSAPLHEGDLSEMKCLKVEYSSQSIWLTSNLPFSSSRDFSNYSMPETGS